jgi:DNA-binding transcriptional MocR family regulator
MNRNKPYKRGKKGTGRHVQLPEWLQASEAWRTMKPGPRALYIELKRRYNGRNNGAIILSHRQAADALNVHRNTVGAWFEELEARGFIWMAQGPHLGPSGIGQASVWGLAEEMTQDMKPARKTFMEWRENQEPRTKTVPPRHKRQDAEGEVSLAKPSPVLKIVT